MNRHRFGRGRALLWGVQWEQARSFPQKGGCCRDKKGKFYPVPLTAPFIPAQCFFKLRFHFIGLCRFSLCFDGKKIEGRSEAASDAVPVVQNVEIVGGDKTICDCIPGMPRVL
jgi:hypothetical protein